MTRWARTAFAAACIAALPLGALAQAWPERPVRLVIPFPPGGTLDKVGRMLAQRLQEQLGQTFIVDNRPGGNGVIGGDAVAKALPDGYTLLFNASTFVTAPILTLIFGIYGVTLLGHDLSLPVGGWNGGAWRNMILPVTVLALPQTAIVARMKAGDTLIPDMVKVIYKDVDKRLHAPAAHSVLAHVIQLVEEGRVIADGPLTIATHYRLAA